MRISTTVRHGELHPDDRAFAETRLARFDRFARDIREIHLVVTAEGYRHVAEVTLRLKHRDIVCREESNEPRHAIDLVSDRVEQQLRRLHERRVKHDRSPRSTNGATAEPSPETDDGEAFEDLGEA